MNETYKKFLLDSNDISNIGTDFDRSTLPNGYKKKLTTLKQLYDENNQITQDFLDLSSRLLPELDRTTKDVFDSHYVSEELVSGLGTLCYRDFSNKAQHASLVLNILNDEKSPSLDLEILKSLQSSVSAPFGLEVSSDETQSNQDKKGKTIFEYFKEFGKKNGDMSSKNYSFMSDVYSGVIMQNEDMETNRPIDFLLMHLENLDPDTFNRNYQDTSLKMHRVKDKDKIVLHTYRGVESFIQRTLIALCDEDNENHQDAIRLIETMIDGVVTDGQEKTIYTCLADGVLSRESKLPVNLGDLLKTLKNGNSSFAPEKRKPLFEGVSLAYEKMDRDKNYYFSKDITSFVEETEIEAQDDISIPEALDEIFETEALIEGLQTSLYPPEVYLVGKTEKGYSWTLIRQNEKFFFDSIRFDIQPINDDLVYDFECIDPEDISQETVLKLHNHVLNLITHMREKRQALQENNIPRIVEIEPELVIPEIELEDESVTTGVYPQALPEELSHTNGIKGIPDRLIYGSTLPRFEEIKNIMSEFGFNNKRSKKLIEELNKSKDRDYRGTDQEGWHYYAVTSEKNGDKDSVTIIYRVNEEDQASGFVYGIDLGSETEEN